ncbi:MAG TPA: aminotransferase class I/II-fold pyridoxal phosphate-dependent enzyme [Pseudolabrys sp.]|nr:aminotransferase class I/II-fold pyridoxal phosphate-dependent enzyme [Pseudolabrys sp.]
MANLREPSRRAGSMPRSAIREIMSLAATIPDVIHLEVGEPDAATPIPIIERAFGAVRAGATKYAPNAGLKTLREMVAKRCSSRLKQDIAADRIVITTGAIGGLFSSMFAVLDPGDEVLIPDPGWPNYEAICHLAGATPIRYAMPASRSFLPDLAELQSLITPKTKAILINTPGNPTGAVFPRALMQGIVELVREHGLYLVSDEIYEDIVFDGEHVSATEFGADDNVFIVSGFSKSYAMTGWRLGWLVCPPALAATAASLQEPTTSCASTPSQMAGEGALLGDQQIVADFRATFHRRRDLVVAALAGTSYLPIVPAGAFYALVDVSAAAMTSFEVAKAALLDASVAVVPGSTFGPGTDRYVRIAYTIEDQRLVEGLRRLREFLERQHSSKKVARS